MTTSTLAGLLLADGWTMHGEGAGWWAPMMVGMALFWGAIILGLVWLVRGGLERRQRQPEEGALAILERRFAEGALSLDDYRQRRAVLVSATGPVLDAGGGTRKRRRRSR